MTGTTKRSETEGQYEFTFGLLFDVPWEHVVGDVQQAAGYKDLDCKREVWDKKIGNWQHIGVNGWNYLGREYRRGQGPDIR